MRKELAHIMGKFTPIQLPLAIDGFTVEIPLTKGYVAIVDAIDADLAQFSWTAHVKKREVYARRDAQKFGKRTRYHMHRMVLERMLGRPLDATEYPDHIHGNGLDNRRSNLRVATIGQNNRNSRKPTNNSSGYKGVCFAKDRNKWRAYISVNNKMIWLGGFNTPEEAHAVYYKAAREYFGEFARLE